MTSQVYLVGSDVPLWVDEPPDLLVLRVENAVPSAMLRVTSLVTHKPGDDPYCEARASYVRADQIAYVAPLGPGARELLKEARSA